MKYNKEYIDLLSKLSSINPGLVVQRQEDDNVVKMASMSKNLFYELRAPKETWDFDGDDISFFIFSEFYNIFKAFDDVAINQKDMYMFVGESASKIRYTLSPRRTIRGVFKELMSVDYEIEVPMPSDLITLINNRSSLVNSEVVQFKSNSEGEIILRAFGRDHSNEWKHKLEDAVSQTDSFDATFPIDLFHKAPKGSYRLKVSQKGLARLEMLSDDFSLSLTATGTEV